MYYQSNIHINHINHINHIISIISYQSFHINHISYQSHHHIILSHINHINHTISIISYQSYHINYLLSIISIISYQLSPINHINHIISIISYHISHIILYHISHIILYHINHIISIISYHISHIILYHISHIILYHINHIISIISYHIIRSILPANFIPRWCIVISCYLSCYDSSWIRSSHMNWIWFITQSFLAFSEASAWCVVIGQFSILLHFQFEFSLVPICFAGSAWADVLFKVARFNLIFIINMVWLSTRCISISFWWFQDSSHSDWLTNKNNNNGNFISFSKFTTYNHKPHYL